MKWSHIIIIGFILQSIFILNIDGNVYRRRRQRRQTSGSLYGTNAYLGASAPSGFNYPASYNIKGVRLNNPDARDLNGNPLLSSSSNTGIGLTSVDSNGEPRPQIQQTYGTNDQALLNQYFSGSSFPSGSSLNTQLFRDVNGNLIPISPSFYSQSNAQQAYPPNPNQVLTNRDLYGTNNNNNNNNQYPYNNNQLPNNNNYGAPMGSNNNQLPGSNSYGGPMRSNNNQLPNSNSYGGPMGGGNNNNQLPNADSYSGSYGNNRNNLVPNSNTYSGYQGTLDNTNGWSNNNRYNSYGGGNSYYPNRDTNYNNNNRYGNPYYNHSIRLSTSVGLMIISFILISILSHFK